MTFVSVYVMLGQPYEFVGLMDHLQDRGLLDTGEYFVVGVHVGQYDPLNPQRYFQGMCAYDIAFEYDKFKYFDQVLIYSCLNQFFKLISHSNDKV